MIGAIQCSTSESGSWRKPFIGAFAFSWAAGDWLLRLCVKMWVEILVGNLKEDWIRKDLDDIIAWSNEDKTKEGIINMRYFLSEDRKNFVMLVEYKTKEDMERITKKWEEGKFEQQEWFQEMMSKVFQAGQSKYYEQIA